MRTRRWLVLALLALLLIVALVFAYFYFFTYCCAPSPPVSEQPAQMVDAG